VSGPSQESERLCVLEHSINLASFYNNLLDFVTVPVFWFFLLSSISGAVPGGGTPAPPPKIGKNMIFWRKMNFHTKYPKHFRAYLRSAQFF
jgi:hypothetical protein